MVFTDSCLQFRTPLMHLKSTSYQFQPNYKYSQYSASPLPLKFELGAKNKFFFFFNSYVTRVTDDVLLTFAVSLGTKSYNT